MKSGDVWRSPRRHAYYCCVDWGFASSQALLDRSPTLLVHTQRNCKSVARLGASVMDLELIHIEKLVAGRAGLGTLASGPKGVCLECAAGRRSRVRLIKKSVHMQRLLRKKCAPRRRGLRRANRRCIWAIIPGK